VAEFMDSLPNLKNVTAFPEDAIGWQAQLKDKNKITFF